MNRFPLLLLAISCDKYDIEKYRARFQEDEGCGEIEQTWYVDEDKDGYVNYDSQYSGACPPADEEYYVLEGEELGEDCDDYDPSIGAAETYYLDDDEDGYGDAASDGVARCEPAVSYVSNNEDCDDTDAAVSPSASEECGDGVDNDCNGTVDTDVCWTGTTDLTSKSDDVTTIAYNDEGGYAGTSLGPGDINCDGQSDLVIAAPGQEYSGVAGVGGLHALLGPVTDLASAGQITLFRHLAQVQGTEAGDLGDLMVVDDLDDDGCADILAFAPEGGAYAAGKFYAVQGDEALSQYGVEVKYTTATLEVDSEEPLELEAMSVMTGMDGDESSRHVAMGAPYLEGLDGSSDVGAVIVVPGSEFLGVESEEYWPMIGDVPEGEAGSALAPLDVDGDGYEDLVVGAPGADSAYFVFGEFADITYLSEEAAVTGITDTGFGRIVVPVGDANGDGYADFLAGSDDATYLFLGGEAVPETTANAFASVTADDSLGMNAWTATALGDTDADGASDFAFTWLSDMSDAEGRGRTTLYYGPLAGAVTTDDADASFVGGDGTATGFSTAALGDDDGDARADFVVGGPWDSSHAAFAGSAYLIYGRGDD